MKIIKKHLKLILFIITCLLVYLIYHTSSTRDKINYISLGDGYAEGINCYEKKDYGYTDYLKEEIRKKNHLNYYFEGFSKKENSINDLYKNILINERNKKQEGIKQALRESNLLTITIGFNDLLYKKSLTPTILESRQKEIIQEIILELDQLMMEIKKYYKKEIYLVGYYNFYPQDSVDKILLDLLNKEYKKYAKRKNITYIEIENDLSKYYENPNSYYPSTLGYQEIYHQILKKIDISQ